MRAFALLVLACAALLLSMAPNLARPAYACSPVRGYNPVSDSDLVVAGRFGQWERLPGDRIPGFERIRMRIAVDWVFKGVPVDEVTLIDSASLSTDGRWIGAAGQCGTFISDPAGQYAVIGLERRADGTYSAWLFSRFSVGAEPGSAAYQEAVERVLGNGEAALYLADPRPCIPSPGETSCTDQRRALWEADASAWAAQGVTDAQARLNATIAFRVAAGDQATIAELARAAGQPYVQVGRVGYLAEGRELAPLARSSPEEFVELVNLGGADQDLTGWTVQLPDRGLTLAVPPGVVLKPGEPCRLAQVDSSSRRCTIRIEVDDLWPDDGGRVLLVDAEGVVRADLRYSADPYNQPPPPHLQGVRLPR